MRKIEITSLMILLASCGMSKDDKDELNRLRFEKINLETEIGALQKENEEMKLKLQEYYKVSNNPNAFKDAIRELSTSYVVLKIEYKLLNPDNSTSSNWTTYYSSIKEVMNWDEDIKYKMLDNEQATIEYKTNTRIKVNYREASVFKTYAEASKFYGSLKK